MEYDKYKIFEIAQKYLKIEPLPHTKNKIPMWVKYEFHKAYTIEGTIQMMTDELKKENIISENDNISVSWEIKIHNDTNPTSIFYTKDEYKNLKREMLLKEILL